MPYIEMKFGKTLTKEERYDLHQHIYNTITLLPGKSKDNCMITICDNCDMFMRGKQDACVFADLRLFGASPQEAKQAFVSSLFEYTCSHLDIDPKLFYMNIVELDSWVSSDKLRTL